MKKTGFLFISLILILLTACGGSTPKETPNNINRKNIVGKWKAISLEIRDLPPLVEEHMGKDDLKQMLNSNNMDSVWIEFKGDNTFTMSERQRESFKGKWKMTRRKMELENSEITISVKVLSLSKKEMELDFAPFYQEQMPMVKNFFGKAKIVLSFERVE
ncbi:MAG: hypothetical protein E6767_02515 [Dysgonomonas sp.]|nr:hypothetical protein [Dysgonomonas sp.]